MSDFRTEDSLISTVVEAGAAAINQYLEMAGDASAWDIPEYWLKSEIAHAFYKQQKYYLYLEHRLSDLLRYGNSGREVPLALERERQTGRVDMALYERTLSPTDAGLSAVIEVKKITNDWCLNEDADRIIDISRVWDGAVCGVVAGLFLCKNEDQARSLFAEIEKRLSEVPGVSTAKIMASPLTRDRRGAYSGIAAVQVC